MKYACYLATGRSGFLVMGLALGLIAGLNFQGLWPNVPLHASATDGYESFSIATGLVDNDVEALYFLDYLTGDLVGAVINPKTGKFNSRFTYNISQDFTSGGRNAKYLMVTGLANMPRGRAGFQPANSIVYVADAQSGQIAAYIMPWNSSMQAAGKPQEGVFQTLDVQQFRTTVVRD
ncbi:hypothetical protein NG895_02985 [Aeoliella sp. ICT_H6.2]|uniref:Uncharacterized protein n=1 Tax=Aeoliella straminimaris TaxID=2954799 RepID=A0A9X2F6T4_9BACT|nr:hypothetical protein [Aeoliella straminimaris]MCO6042864.1 hypothetical protein [Aeoliella straminimaris]